MKYVGKTKNEIDQDAFEQRRDEQNEIVAANQKNLIDAAEDSHLHIQKIFDAHAFEAARAVFDDVERTVSGYHHDVDEKARRMRAEMRDHIAKAEQGFLKHNNLGIKEGTSAQHAVEANNKIALNAAGVLAQQSAYQAAYDNTVTFNIGGSNVDFKQGELNDVANDFVKKQEEQLQLLQLAGASAEDIKKAQDTLLLHQRIAELTDPHNGPMTPEKQQQLQSIFDQNPEVAKKYELGTGNYKKAKECKSELDDLEERKNNGEISQQDYETKRDAMIKGMDPAVKELYDDMYPDQAKSAQDNTGPQGPEKAVSPVGATFDPTAPDAGVRVMASPTMIAFNDGAIDFGPDLRTTSFAKSIDGTPINAESIKATFQMTASNQTPDPLQGPDQGPDIAPDAPKSGPTMALG